MYLLPPDESTLECIKKEDIYRSAESLKEDVNHLIEWLSKQPHLPNITDRAWLSHFISGCKYNLQRTKQTMESYFISRAECPEFLGSFTREQLTAASKSGTVFLFPKLTPEGYRVFCTKSNPTTDEDDFDFMLFCQVSVATLDLQLKEEPMYGNIALYDLKHIRLSQFLAFTPTMTKKLLRIAMDSAPLRVKGVHYINPPKFMGRLITFFKMFIPPKIRDRLYVHESIEDLYEYIPREVLPDIYGGTNGSIEKYEEATMDALIANKDWLEARPVADLSKRPVGSSITNELDMNGTFKQLQID